MSLLQRVGEAVLPAVLTAGGLIGFVAFAGSVIVWTRFSAAQVPPDQVVAAYPRGELVAIASALLLLFGFVLLAVIAFFLIDQKSGGGIGYSRGLLVLLGVEGMVAILLVHAPSTPHRILASELFLLPAVIAFWATFVAERTNLSSDGGEGDDVGDGADSTLARFGDAIELYLLKSRLVSLAIGTVLLVTLAASMLIFAPRLVGASGLAWEEAMIGGLAVIALVPSIYLIYILIRDESIEKRDLNPGEIPFSRSGQALILILLAIAAVAPSLVLRSGWLPFSLGAAAVLIAGLWRVALITQKRFFWYGLAVFISVPLFGTLTGMFRSIADPQVQPMALIRKADGPDQAIQGLYVTETDDRIYFATVATEGCTTDLVPHSGRLLWVPKSEVVAMSVGPLQRVEEAAKTALEMSYALTPAVETPAGDHVSLTVAEKRKTAKSESSSLPERRLESVGSAVQPNFGAGLRLSPETASPGDVVTLRMSAPNHNDEVKGFGSRREGRTLRLGGVPVDIVKEEARDPFDSEFVESEDGQALSLVKGALYTRHDGEYVEIGSSTSEPSEDEGLFVKVNDAAVAAVNDKGLADDGYLRLADGPSSPPRLEYSDAGAPEVVLEDGTELGLNPRLLRQDWHEDHIGFRVPPHGTTGPVTVECKQLAGQPLLRIARPPIARISVRIEPGSRRIFFDSSHSIDANGKIVSRQWSVKGIERGDAEGLVEALPPSTQSYSVRLKVTDSEGQMGTAELHLLRLPMRLMTFKHRPEHPPRHPAVFRQVKAAFLESTLEEPAQTIQFEARPGELSPPPSPDQTMVQARRVQRRLLHSKSASTSRAPASPEGLIVKTMAFGAGCPAEQRADEGRLDILILGKGVKGVPPPACHVVRLQSSRRLLPPP